MQFTSKCRSRNQLSFDNFTGGQNIFSVWIWHMLRYFWQLSAILLLISVWVYNGEHSPGDWVAPQWCRDKDKSNGEEQLRSEKRGVLFCKKLPPILIKPLQLTDAVTPWISASFCKIHNGQPDHKYIVAVATLMYLSPVHPLSCC